MPELDMKQAAEAVDKLNRAWEAQKATMDELSGEVKKIGAEMPETKAKFDKIEKDIEKALKTSEDAFLAVKRSQRVITDQHGNAIDLDAKAQEWADQIAKRRGSRVDSFGNDDMTAYKSALEAYIRKDEKVLNGDQVKALSVGSDPDGGFFVSPDMSGRIVQKVFETSPMRAFASVQVISTDALKGIYDNDEVDVFWEGETQTPQEGGTPQVGEWRIPVHEMRTIVKASQQLLEDAAVNIESWLADKAAAKMARAENLTFVSGSGAGRPRGFLTYTDNADLTIGIEQLPTGTSGAFAAAPSGGDVLINALYSLKAPYSANATWFMNRTVFAAVRKLKDGDGAYLWQPGIAAGQPVTILGKPYASFEDMPNLGAGSLSIAVGDMAQAYQIVDRLGISTLRDPYCYKPFVGFYCRKRVGGMVVNGEALKLIRFNT